MSRSPETSAGDDDPAGRCASRLLSLTEDARRAYFAHLQESDPEFCARVRAAMLSTAARTG